MKYTDSVFFAAGQTFLVDVTIKVPNISKTNLTQIENILQQVNPEPNNGDGISFQLQTDSAAFVTDTKRSGNPSGVTPTSGGVREAAIVMGTNVLLALSIMIATTAFF